MQLENVYALDLPSHSMAEHSSEDSVSAANRQRPVLIVCHNPHLLKTRDTFLGDPRSSVSNVEMCGLSLAPQK
jgi:hypothetical protein